MIDARAVREAARGRWPEILAALGLPAAMLTRKHGACPGCGGRDRFRFDDRNGAGTFICSRGGGDPLAGDGFGLLRHVYGWPFPEKLRAVADVLGMRAPQASAPHRQPSPSPPRRQPRPSPPRRPKPEAAEQNRKAAASLRRVWVRSEPLDLNRHAPVRRYLARRGLGAILDDPPVNLRFHPALDYWEAGTKGSPNNLGQWPALVALVRAPDGAAVSVHRTYLTAEGAKAPVAAVRKMMTPARPGALLGAAIRLYPSSDSLAIGEGIESALAARVLDPSRPVWSAINANGLAKLVLPATVRDLLIVADADVAGLGAANALAASQKREGRAIWIASPPESGTDWADVLLDATKGARRHA